VSAPLPSLPRLAIDRCVARGSSHARATNYARMQVRVRFPHPDLHAHCCTQRFWFPSRRGGNLQEEGKNWIFEHPHIPPCDGRQNGV